jgi:hypothetical protein
MPLAIFGINNDGVNLALSLLFLALFALYIALVVYTYLDARRRIEDPVLVACATVGSLIPFIGTIVYTIVRPPEFIDDARERELEIRAAELRVRQLSELSCPNCGFPVEKNYLRCPSCQRRLKDPCHSCGKPVDPRWALCPYCESALPGRGRQQRAPQPQRRGERDAAPRREREPEPRRAPESKPPPRGKRAETQQRSAQREAQRDAQREAPATRQQRAPAREGEAEEEQPARPKR